MNRMLALDANWAPQLEEAVRALQALAPTVLPLSSTSHFRTRMMKRRVGKSGTHARRLPLTRPSGRV